jgi:hypothetical protein
VTEAQLPDESTELLNEDASLLNDDPLLFASLLRSLAVFLTSFFVSLEQAMGASSAKPATAASTN